MHYDGDCKDYDYRNCQINKEYIDTHPADQDIYQQIAAFYPECGDVDWLAKWSAFWWYAVAEKCLFPVLSNMGEHSILGKFKVREIKNVKQTDSLIQSRRSVKLYKLSRPLNLIYKVSFVESTFIVNQLSSFTQGLLEK